MLSYHLIKVAWFRLAGELEGSSCKYVPDIFFFSVVLFFGTFLLCSTLKKFKLTPFFPAKVLFRVTGAL